MGVSVEPRWVGVSVEPRWVCQWNLDGCVSGGWA